MPREPRVVVAQLGAREHYAIPRMCHRAGALKRLFTDFWLNPPRGRLAKAAIGSLPALQRAAGRSTPEIPSNLVRAFSARAMLWHMRSRGARTRGAVYDIHERWGREFAERTARSLNEVDHSAFVGFSSAALEALLHERRAGRLAVLDEIAPTHLEEVVITEERRRFPGLEAEGGLIPPSFMSRLEREWESADRIIVNSEWSKHALAARGVPPTKLFVVPVAYEPGSHGSRPARDTRDGLRVLWLGTLCLRKGLPYALEAARLLEGLPVRFTFAGPSTLDLTRLRWPANAQYLGPVARSATLALWDSHDVFILPTLSDGFAITQVEAMAHGLPVIATHNCGDVVEDGLSGLRIAARDPRALADAVLRFLDREICLAAASERARQRVERFSLRAVWRDLLPVLTA